MEVDTAEHSAATDHLSAHAAQLCSCHLCVSCPFWSSSLRSFFSSLSALVACSLLNEADSLCVCLLGGRLSPSALQPEAYNVYKAVLVLFGIVDRLQQSLKVSLCCIVCYVHSY